MLKIARIQKKGRALITTQLIKKNSIIETSPAITFPSHVEPLIKDTIIYEYAFVDPKSYNRATESRGYMAFGLATLCNHSAQPNAKVEWTEDEIGLWAKLIAIDHIQPNEEITIYYTNCNEYQNF